MTALYGQLFISKFGLKDNGTWFDVLSDLTPKALEKGMERLMKLTNGGKFCEFPPNCMQFRAVCVGFYNELGLPSTHDAFREVKSRAYMTSQNWSHLVVKFTANRLGLDFLKIDDEKRSYSLFKAAYEQVCNLVKQGNELPQMNADVMCLKNSSKEVARNHLSAMRQALGVG